jgi:ketosteroid isomerase-like protein
MKNIILFILVFMLFASCETKQETEKLENIEKVILSKERKSLDLWAQGDPLGYSENFAEDGTYFDDIAAQTRLDSLKEIRNYFTSLKGQIPPHKYEIVDPKVQVYGDIAILTMQYHSTTFDGQPGRPWKATSVYRLTNGDWHVVHAHWSLVKAE